MIIFGGIMNQKRTILSLLLVWVLALTIPAVSFSAKKIRFEVKKEQSKPVKEEVSAQDMLTPSSTAVHVDFKAVTWPDFIENTTTTAFKIFHQEAAKKAIKPHFGGFQSAYFQRLCLCFRPSQAP